MISTILKYKITYYSNPILLGCLGSIYLGFGIRTVLKLSNSREEDFDKYIHNY